MRIARVELDHPVMVGPSGAPEKYFTNSNVAQTPFGGMSVAIKFDKDSRFLNFRFPNGFTQLVAMNQVAVITLAEEPDDEQRD